MVPNVVERRSRQHKNGPIHLNHKSIYNQNQQEISQQEITRELLDRQKEYDKLNKVYIPINSVQLQFSQKKSKYYQFKDAVREAKIKFLEKPTLDEKILKNKTQYCQQQKNSISVIAQIFRNQKTNLNSRSNCNYQRKNKWNLELMLIITIPTICFLVIIFETIF